MNRYFFLFCNPIQIPNLGLRSLGLRVAHNTGQRAKGKGHKLSRVRSCQLFGEFRISALFLRNVISSMIVYASDALGIQARKC